MPTEIRCPTCKNLLEPEQGTLDQAHGSLPAVVYRCDPCDWTRTVPAPRPPEPAP